MTMLNNKKIFLFFILGIFLVSSVYAMEFDNIKSYDAENKTVSISNSFLWIFPLGKVADITLNTPIIYNVIRGKDRLVAEFTINNYETYSNGVFDSLRFSDMNGKEIQRTFVYKYKVLTGTKDIPEYEEVCKIESKNYSNVCRREIVDYHKENVYEWKEFKEEELRTFGKGKITIGIFTDVYPNERVEWIPTLYGVKINEWAEWTEGLNNQLIHVYNFNETSGTSTLDIATSDLNSKRNGTLVGIPNFIASGKFGRAINVSGGNNFVNLSNYNDRPDGRKEFTLSMWVKLEPGCDPAGLLILGTNFSEGNNGSLSINSNCATSFTVMVGTTTFDIGFYPWLSTSSFTHLAVTRNNTNLVLYINNTAYTINGVTGDISFLKDIYLGRLKTSTSPHSFHLDEFYIWNRSLSADEISSLYDGGAGTFFLDLTPGFPEIFLNNPVNDYNSSSSLISFNCSASSDIKLIKNISLYLDGIRNYTVNDGLDNFTELYVSRTIVDGSHNWTCGAYNNESNFTISTNRTFTIDTIYPIVNITFPFNVTYEINYTSINIINISLNFTYFDLHLQSCWYYNGSANVSITCGENSSVEVPYGSHTFFFYANDTFGNEGSTNITGYWKHNIFQNYIYYHNTTIEGEYEGFYLNITKDYPSSISSVNLIYNGTSYSGVVNLLGNEIIISKNITIPPTISETNRTFYWRINLVDGNFFNSDLYIQLTKDIDIDDCSTYSTLIYNFSLVDEGLQNLLTINNSVELNLGILSLEGAEFLNISKTYTSNPIRVCLSTNLSNSTSFKANSIIKYSSQDHAIEYYNIVGAKLDKNTIPYRINLYDLLSSDSTDFKIIFTGSDYQTVKDALIYIERQYISENNTFKTVELPKTDSNGQTVGHFVRNNVIYNIRVIKDDEIIGNFQNVIAFCQDILIGNCQLILNARSSQGTNYSYNETIGLYVQDLKYNATTGLVSGGFIVPDGTPKTILMNISKNDIFGNRTLCSTSITSSSGTLSCNVGAGVDESLLIAELYVDGVPSQKKFFSSTGDGYGSIGFIVWFVITLILIFIFDDNKTGLIISLIMSYIGAISLAILNGSIIGIGASGIWIIVITVLALFRLNKENPQ